MTKRETDTSASEGTTDGESRAETNRRDAPPATDSADALFDVLVEEGVLAVGDDGGVRTTDEFDDTHAIYHDSYVGVDDNEFHEAVAATFGLSDAAERDSSSGRPSADAEAAADLVAERGISRDEFAVYLAVRSHVESAERDSAESRSAEGASADGVNAADLAAMAGMVWEVVPDSPVPAELPDVTDDPESFLAGRDRRVVAVWKRFCDPCEAVKADLPTVLDAVPDGVRVAGADGEAAAEFCRTHGVESAPGFVLADGDDRRTVCESDADAVAERVASFF
ncbi:thioredoxin [Halorussus limi]|uniref:Thioredoxin n=1 Tax=Halorussus limi TaxID=2938695 RepID=A0A8U0HRS3_9EURY|nr:thioredoxin [Halorussus limi]UPV73569.1 thioredoxin [Halorussus limi]